MITFFLIFYIIINLDYYVFIVLRVFITIIVFFYFDYVFWIFREYLGKNFYFKLFGIFEKLEIIIRKIKNVKVFLSILKVINI